MPKSLTGYVMDWCQEHGWTDLFVDHHQYWAFPPGAVMPLPVPANVVQAFNGRDGAEHLQVTYGLICVAVAAIVISLQQQSPMPLVFAFCACAMVVACLDESL